MRLNVVGVSNSRFLPLLVALLTRSDEFHSLKKTLSPCNSSQRLSRKIWVDLPEPSSPSTAIRRPGKFNSAKVFVMLSIQNKRTPDENNVFPYNMMANAEIVSANVCSHTPAQYKSAARPNTGMDKDTPGRDRRTDPELGHRDKLPEAAAEEAGSCRNRCFEECDPQGRRDGLCQNSELADTGWWQPATLPPRNKNCQNRETSRLGRRRFSSAPAWCRFPGHSPEWPRPAASPALERRKLWYYPVPVLHPAASESHIH